MYKKQITLLLIWIVLWISYLTYNIVAVAWSIHQDCKDINHRIETMTYKIMEYNK